MSGLDYIKVFTINLSLMKNAGVNQLINFKG